jgi:hypothetical protein
MIDTDKYEGHSPAPWLRDSNDVHTNDGLRSIADVVILGDGDKLYRECVANARLIADAPLLLEEVKRLRNHIRKMRHWAEPKMHEVHHDAWRKLHEEIYEGDEQE